MDHNWRTPYQYSENLCFHSTLDMNEGAQAFDHVSRILFPFKYLIISSQLQNGKTFAKCCEGNRLSFGTSNYGREAKSSSKKADGYCLLIRPTYPSKPVCRLPMASSHSISFLLVPQTPSTRSHGNCLKLTFQTTWAPLKFFKNVHRSIQRNTQPD